MDDVSVRVCLQPCNAAVEGGLQDGLCCGTVTPRGWLVVVTLVSDGGDQPLCGSLERRDV